MDQRTRCTGSVVASHTFQKRGNRRQPTFSWHLTTQLDARGTTYVRVEINTVLVGLDFYLSVQHPRAMAKEDSASLWDFYTFILLNLLETYTY